MHNKLISPSYFWVLFWIDSGSSSPINFNALEVLVSKLLNGFPGISGSYNGLPKNTRRCDYPCCLIHSCSA